MSEKVVYKDIKFTPVGIDLWNCYKINNYSEDEALFCGDIDLEENVFYPESNSSFTSDQLNDIKNFMKIKSYTL